MPWDLIDQLRDAPFMPEGREQPEMPEDRVMFREVSARDEVRHNGKFEN